MAHPLMVPISVKINIQIVNMGHEAGCLISPLSLDNDLNSHQTKAFHSQNALHFLISQKWFFQHQTSPG